MIVATKNRVIIRQASEERKSAGGLILELKDGADLSKGIVVSVGSNVEGILVGDTVYLSHLGTSVGDDLVSIPAEYVIAVLTP